MTPPAKADRPAAFKPARAAKTPPVAAPEKIAFHGSSFFLKYVNVQSKQLNKTPQTAKLPEEEE
jgi:hypothetical protein